MSTPRADHWILNSARQRIDCCLSLSRALLLRNHWQLRGAKVWGEGSSITALNDWNGRRRRRRRYILLLWAHRCGRWEFRRCCSFLDAVVWTILPASSILAARCCRAPRWEYDVHALLQPYTRSGGGGGARMIFEFSRRRQIQNLHGPKYPPPLYLLTTPPSATTKRRLRTHSSSSSSTEPTEYWISSCTQSTAHKLYTI